MDDGVGVGSLECVALDGSDSSCLSDVFYKGVTCAAKAIVSGSVDIAPYVGDFPAVPRLWRDDLVEVYISGVLASWFFPNRTQKGWFSDVIRVSNVSSKEGGCVYGLRCAIRHADANMFKHGYYGLTSLDNRVNRKIYASGDAPFIDIARLLYCEASRLSGGENRAELFERLADVLPAYAVVLRLARVTNFGAGLMSKH